MNTGFRHWYKRILKGLEQVFKRLLAGACAVFFTTGPRELNDSPDAGPVGMKRVLFLRFDKLGDMIISLPVFETLSREAPETEIEVLASPANRAILAYDPRVSALWVYSKRPWRDLKTLWKLRQRKYDAVVDMICLDSVTALFVSQFFGRRVRRVGIGKSRFAKYYTHHVPLIESNYEHIVDSTLQALTCLGLPSERFVCQAPPATPDSAQSLAETFVNGLKEGRAESDSRIVGVNISAGKPNRMWSQIKFIELFNRLSLSSPQPIVTALCAPADRRRAKSIISNVDVAPGLIPAELDILQVAAIIARLDMLISPDTSLIHIARQYDVPVVGIYPTHGRSCAQWRPYGQPDGLVQGGSDCDIHDITPEQVYQEYVRVCERTQQITV